MSDYLITQLRATPNIAVRLGTSLVDGRGEGRLESIVLKNAKTGQTEDLSATAVFIMVGADPRSDWLQDVLQCDPQGFVLTGRDLPDTTWQLNRPPFPFETSLAGVFAVGDIRYGSVKRVAAAVGEGSVAVGSVHQYMAELDQTSRPTEPSPMRA